MTGARPTTPLVEANAAGVEAAHMRSEWLVGLDENVLSIDALLEFACTPEGRPLLRLPLRQVLLSSPRLGPTRVARILARIQELLGVQIPVRSMTVAWLLDSRVGGRRFMAWLDATQILRSEPWSGFPYGSPFSTADQAIEPITEPGEPR